VNVGIDLSSGRRLNEKIAVLVERFLTTFCSDLRSRVEMADRYFTREQQIRERWQAAQHVHPAGSPTSFESCHRSPRRSHPVRLVAPSAVNEASAATSTRERSRSIRDRSLEASSPRAASFVESASPRSKPSLFVMTQTYNWAGIVKMGVAADLEDSFGLSCVDAQRRPHPTGRPTPNCSADPRPSDTSGRTGRHMDIDVDVDVGDDLFRLTGAYTPRHAAVGITAWGGVVRVINLPAAVVMSLWATMAVRPLLGCRGLRRTA
jgi:hypothetical protein